MFLHLLVGEVVDQGYNNMYSVMPWLIMATGRPDVISDIRFPHEQEIRQNPLPAPVTTTLNPCLPPPVWERRVV